MDTFPEKDLGLTYEQGLIIGLYLGDGSLYKRDSKYDINEEVTFSLNEQKSLVLPNIRKALNQLGIDNNLNINITKNKFHIFK